MKSFRKFLSISLAVLMILSTVIVGTASASAADTTELYCRVTQSWWTADDAAVGVHYWGGSSETTWPGVKGTPVAGEEGLWKFEVPSDVAGLIFVRMGNSGEQDGKDWGAKTPDLTIPTDGKNLFTVTSTSAVWGDPGVEGEWSTYGTQPTTATTAPTTTPSDDVVVNIKSQQNLFATETRTYKKGDVFDLSLIIDMKGKKPLDAQLETYFDHTGLKVISETVHEKLEDTAVTNITSAAQEQYNAVYFNFTSARGYNITTEATLVTYKVQVLSTAKSTEEMTVNYKILRAVESDPTNPVNCVIDSVACDADYAVKVAVSPSTTQPTTATTAPTTTPSDDVVVNIKSQQNLFATETRTYKKGDVFDLSLIIDMKGKKPLDAQLETYFDHTGLKVISETVHEKLEDTAVTNITSAAQEQYNAVFFNFTSARGYNITTEATLVTYKVQVLSTAKSIEEMTVNYKILRAVESDPTNPVNCVIDSIACDADYAVKVAVSPSTTQPTTATTAPTTQPTTASTAPTTEPKTATYTYYFAPLQSDIDAGCTYVVNICSDADVENPWFPYTMEATDVTYNGKAVYKAEITVPETQNIKTMQIQSFEQGTWKHQILLVDNVTTPYATYDGKVIVATESDKGDVFDFVADPTQPTTASTAPTTESSEPTTESTEPTTESSEPTTESTAPTTESTEPTTESTAPTTESTEPTTEQTEPTTEPVPVFDYYVVGSPELFGANWAEDPANGMTQGVDGNYYLAIENAPAGTFSFKVKDSNGGWHPDGMGNDGVVTTTGGEKIIFRYDPNAGFAVISTDGQMPTYPAPTQPTTETTEPTTAPTQPTTAPTQATEPTTKPQTLGEADKTITKTNTDKGDPKGSTFALLRLNQKSTGKKTMNLSWTKVKGAKGYIIYGAKCGKALKKIKTVSAKTTKYTVKNLKKGTYYKYLVVAYKTVGNSKVTCAMSKVTHATTKGGKFGNPTKVTKVKDKVTVKKGKKITLKPSFKSDKKVKKHVAIRYESTNTKVATVNSKGVIKGVAKNKKCTVYVYAQNGVYKKVTVSVK